MLLRLRSLIRELSTFLAYVLLIQSLQWAGWGQSATLRPAPTPVAARDSRGTTEPKPALSDPVERLNGQGLVDFRPVLSVGRTLSATSTQGVVNNTLSITYTVFNLKQDPVSAVTLTTTLAAGVTFRDAVPAAGRDGQDVSVNLGDIAPLGSKQVMLTVTLPNPVPTQIDAGARAYGAWLGRTFSATAAAAILRTTPPAANLLASTPDANAADPFVASKAAELGGDATRIFTYVRDNIGFELYRGSLRGARGAIWSNAANSLDKASLLIALLRASGIPARYATGTLTDPAAANLIRAMFPALLTTTGAVGPGITPANPAADSALLAEAREHYWVQFDAGAGFVDADPSFPGAALGQTFTGTSSTFAEAPDNLRHKVTVRLNAETYLPGFFGLAGGPGSSKVLERGFSSVELIGHPLTVGHFVNTTQAGFIITALNHKYSPYLQVGQNDDNPSDDPLFRGTDYQEVFSNLAFANQVLTGLFLEFDVTGPGAAARTYSRTIYDRIGFAARTGQGTSNVQIPAGNAAAVSPIDNVTISVESSLLDAGLANSIEARDRKLAADLATLSAQFNPNSNSPQDAPLRQQVLQASISRGISLTQLLASAFAMNSNERVRIDSANLLVKGYRASPRIILTSLTARQDGQNSITRLEIDRQKDDIRAITFPGQNPEARRSFLLTYGVAESAIESSLLSQLTTQGGGTTVTRSLSAADVMQAADAQKTSFYFYSPNSLAVLTAADYSSDAKARISDAVQRGKVVFAPAKAVTINGVKTVSWYEIDPETGETVDTGEDGGHQGFVEYVAVLTVATLAAGITGFFSIRIALECARQKNYTCAGLALGVGALVILLLVLVAGWAGAFAYTAAQGAVTSSAFGAAGNAAGAMAGTSAAAGGAAGAGTAANNGDPPLNDYLYGANLPIAFVNPAAAIRRVTRAASLAAGGVQANLVNATALAGGTITATWAADGTSSFDVTQIAAAGATIRNAANQVVGTGAVTFASPNPTAAELSGAANVNLNGTGSLGFHDPSLSGLAAGGQWQSYTAAITGTPLLRINTGALSLNGALLPAGIYTIAAADLNLTGRGATAVPVFAANATANVASGGSLSLGPASGSLAAGGTNLDPRPGARLLGFTGSITVTPNAGANTIAVTGSAQQVLRLDANPIALNATQNAAVSFDTVLQTTLGGDYDLTAEAPPGWQVSIDQNGRVSVTPAPGLQAGVFGVFLTARSVANPSLFTQSDVTITLNGTAPGVSLNLVADPVFTVPIGSAQLASAYRAEIRNTGPAADDFNITFPTPPAGFNIQASNAGLRIPAGGRAIIGVYLVPSGALPAANTAAPFTVRVTSATNGAISDQKSDTFVVPAVPALTVNTAPSSIVTVPGPVNSTLTLDSVGNVAVNATLTANVDANLALAGLPPNVTLAPGQKSTHNLTITPQPGAPLNSALGVLIDAAYNQIKASASVFVQLTSPAAQSAFAAIDGAATLGRTDIATSLSLLGGAINQLAAAPGGAPQRAAVTAYLNGLIAQMNAPYLANFTAELTAARDLVAASNAGNQQAALDNLNAVLARLDNVLASPAAYDFDFALIPTNTAVAQPNTPTVFQVFLRNKGTTSNTYALSLGSLPGGVNGSLADSSLTLAPGAQGTVNLTITPTTGQSFEFSVTASVNGVAGSARTIKGTLTSRNEFLSVVDVVPTPGFMNAGTPVNIKVRLANTVNQSRNVNVGIDIKDATNTTVRTVPAQAATLVVTSLITSIDFNVVSTTGLANGTYTLAVTVTDPTTNQPIPGGAGTGTLLIGSPVTATLVSTPQTLPPGNGQVTSTLSVSTTGGNGNGALTLLGSVDLNGQQEDVVVRGNYAYVCGPNGLTTVDVSNPASPQQVNFLGSPDSGPLFVCHGFGGDKLAGMSGNGGTTNFYSFSLANPAAPARLFGPSGLGGNFSFTGDFAFQGDIAWATTVWFNYFIFSNTIFAQHGVLYGYNFANPASPVVTGATSDLGSPMLDILFPNATTAYVGSTTGTNGDTVGTGRLLVTNISNPAAPTIAQEILVPNTSLAQGLAISGNTLLVTGLTSGWNNPGIPDFLPRANLTITTFDISNINQPVLLKTVVTNRPSYLAWWVETVGPNLFALSFAPSGTSPTDPYRMVLIDTTDPLNPVLTDGPLVPEMRRLRFVGGRLYAPTQTGLNIYSIGGGSGLTYTAQVQLPKGGQVAYNTNSFSTAPTSITPGATFDTVAWTNPASNNISWTSNVSNIQPGQVLPVTLPSSVNFTAPQGSGTITLPITNVTSEQVLGLAPASATVQPGQLANFGLTVRNPTAAPLTWTLAVSGVLPSWVTLPATVTVPANSQSNVALQLRSELAALAGVYGFTVTAVANGFQGSVSGTLILQGVGVIGPLAPNTPRGVQLSLTPMQATGGRGVTTNFTVRVTNAGTTTDTFNLTAALPAGFTGVFTPASLEVPPGLENFREAVFKMTPPLNAVAGPAQFTVTARSATDANSTDSRAGTLNVSTNGVSLTLAPNPGAPGAAMQLTVTNTGTVNDTFDLTVGGPAALFSGLATTSVTLAPSASQVVPINVGTAPGTQVGPQTLLAQATSRGNNAVSATAAANIDVPARKGVTAVFSPARQGVAAPNTAAFLLQSRNTGSIEDAYSATITGTTGDVAASLVDLAGAAVQSVPLFRLPGGAVGQLVLNARLNSGTQASVTVRVVSLTDPSVFSIATALVAPGAGPPVAVAGKPRNVPVGKFTMLDGSGSFDPGGGRLSFSWRLTGKPPASTVNDLRNAASPRPFFRPDVDGVYVWELTVNNGAETSAPDIVRFTATGGNVPPNAHAGRARNALRNSPVILDGSLSDDPDQSPNPLTFAWWLKQKPPASALPNSIVGATFTPDVAGVYVATLTVHDGAAASTDDVTITVYDAGAPPNAIAGRGYRILPAVAAPLDGRASNDPETIPQPLTYRWRFMFSQLGDVQLDTPDSSTSRFTPQAAGIHVARLDVNDGTAESFDQIAVMVGAACDATADGLFDQADLDVLAQLLGQPAGPNDPLDRNGDGMLTIADLQACSGSGAPIPQLPRIFVDPTFITFQMERNAPAPPPITVQVTADETVQVNVRNLFQTPWVTADPSNPIVSGLRPTLVRIGVIPNGLPVGVHDTTLYFVPSNGANTVAVRVRLIITEPAKLLASRTRIEFRYRIGEAPPPPQQLYVISTTGQYELTAAGGGQAWLNISPNLGNTGTPFVVTATPGSLLPGTYDGSVRFSAAGVPPLTVPVTLEVLPAPPRFVPSDVLHAATLRATALAPNQIFLIRGRDFGRAAVFQPGAGVTSAPLQLGDTQVLADGLPIPLLEVQPSEIRAVLPQGLAAKLAPGATVDLEVIAYGVSSGRTAVPLTALAPGLFSRENTGSGQAQALNQDGTPNTTANPAAPGTVISLFWTGGGAATPALPDGQIAGPEPSALAVPVRVEIDGQPVETLFAGRVPGAVNGALQTNVRISPQARPGNAIAVQLIQGEARSQPGMVIAIR